MGRRPVPIEVKKRKGTYRKDRDPFGGAPQLSQSLPKPAPDLNERATQMFYTMLGHAVRMGTADVSCGQALSDLARAMETDERLTRYLDEVGSTYPTYDKDGNLKLIRTRPEYAQVEAARTRKLKLLTEFGFTPASAGKVSQRIVQKENPFQALAGDEPDETDEVFAEESAEAT